MYMDNLSGFVRATEMKKRVDLLFRVKKERKYFDFFFSI